MGIWRDVQKGIEQGMTPYSALGRSGHFRGANGPGGNEHGESKTLPFCKGTRWTGWVGGGGV